MTIKQSASKKRELGNNLRAKKAKKESIPVLLRQLMQVVAAESVGQAEMIEALMLGIISGHHVLFIGPPGCNKTGLIDSLIKRIAKARLFMTTMNKFAEPDILLGPISIAGLKADKLVRNHKGYLPDADFAFIGEIFSGNASTLPVLNRVLNERQIEEEGQRIDLPLRSVFADTNWYPQQQLAAVYDRFLLRHVVGYLGTNDTAAFTALMELPAPEKAPDPVIDLHSLLNAVAAAQCVDVPGPIVLELFEIRTKLHSEQLQISDRRWKQSLDVVRSAAYLDGRTVVEHADLYALRFVLWAQAKDIKPMQDVIDPYKEKRVDDAAKSSVEEAIKIFKTAANSRDVSSRMDAASVLDKIAERTQPPYAGFISALEDSLTSLITDDTVLTAGEAEDAVKQIIAAQKVNLRAVKRAN